MIAPEIYDRKSVERPLRNADLLLLTTYAFVNPVVAVILGAALFERAAHDPLSNRDRRRRRRCDPDDPTTTSQPEPVGTAPGRPDEIDR
jgi:hypothetical protein